MPWRALPVFLLLGAACAWVVPVGEAPDEPAHLAYVDHVVRERALPPPDPAAGPLAYESFQPPLDYLVSAGLLAVVHGRPAAYPFVPNPELDFHQAGSRAFVPQPDAVAEAGAIRRLRLARLFWGALTALFVLRTVRLLASPRAAWAAAPFVFCPQLLFNSATVNNDTAVTALSSAAILGLCRLARRDGSPAVAAGTGLAAGLAVWAKASGLFLAVPLAWAAVRLRGRLLAALALPYLLLLSGWSTFARARSNPLISGLDAATAAAPGLDRLLGEPTWPLSVWISFWGKFGWLNLRLPAPVYLLFVPPTLLVLWGMVAVLRGRRPEERVLLVAVLANVALLLAYLIGGGWQLQGRYLFPSLAALAGLAAAGGADLDLRPKAWSWTVYAGAGAFGIWWIWQAY